jgi:hypothetical protein
MCGQEGSVDTPFNATKEAQTDGDAALAHQDSNNSFLVARLRIGLR